MTETTPIAAATTLRSEMRERTAQAVEALVKRIGPHLVALDPDAMATVLTCELVRVVEGVEHEHLSRLAEIAQPG